MLLYDGADSHQRGEKLQVPDNIRLLPLLPYSPELYPMGNVWDTHDAILQACAKAWAFLTGDPERTRSIAMRSWTCVNV